MFRHVLVAAVAVWALASTPAWASPVYSDVFFFGTSELDTGNWLLNDSLKDHPLAPTADKGYWEGRWQEGPAWSDSLAQGLGHDATASLAGGQNYAYGIGWLGPLPGDPPPAPGTLAANEALYFGTQIGEALADYPGGLPGDALYVISIGFNDSAFYGRSPDEAHDVAALALFHIERLVDAGATQFLVQTLGGGADPSSYAYRFNEPLLTGLAGLEGTYGIDVSILDTRAFNQTVVLEPGFLASLGITDFGTCIADPVCLAAAKAAAEAGNPYLGNPHLSFDDVHRNTKLAEVLGQYAANQLPRSVPEPGTMSLLAAGLVAALVRRRNRA